MFVSFSRLQKDVNTVTMRLHVYYSVRGPNSCVKKIEKKAWIILFGTPRRGSPRRCVGTNIFVSNFRVCNSIEPYAAA